MFWARIRPGDSLGEWATWLAYSLMAFVFLLIVSYFKVNNIWALFSRARFSAGLAKGSWCRRRTESLPLSISFTALAWHATHHGLDWMVRDSTISSHLESFFDVEAVSNHRALLRALGDYVVARTRRRSFVSN
ncbi:MAG: hypothetical protein U0X93_02700 [Anaerolineales bacterium]